jgi:HEAT repeat protein
MKQRFAVRRAASMAAMVLGAAALAGSAAVNAQEVGSAAAFLETLRGTQPAACELVSRGLDNGWGGHIGEAVSLTSDDAQTLAVLRWATSGVDARSLDVLRTAIRDFDACVRRIAAQLLGRHGDDSAVSALMDALRSDDVSIAEAGALGLGYSRAERAGGGLIDALRAGAPRVRRMAAWALGRIGSGASIPALTEALARDADAAVRRTAAWALGQIE